MATKSILKDVNIKGRSNNHKFIAALENAERNRSIDVVLSRPVRKVKTQEGIRKLFGDL